MDEAATNGWQRAGGTIAVALSMAAAVFMLWTAGGPDEPQGPTEAISPAETITQSSLSPEAVEELAYPDFPLQYNSPSPQELIDTGAPPPSDPLESWVEYVQTYRFAYSEVELRSALEEETELIPDRIDELVSLAEPAAALVPRGSRDDASDGGRSQLGGYPLLAPTYSWPSLEGEALTLAAQLDLDAMPDDLQPWLPERGLLQFYMPLDEDFSFLEPPFRGESVVLWFENTTGFVHRTDGRAALGDRAVALDFVRFLSLPPGYSARELRHWSQADFEASYWYQGDWSVCDQFGGWSSGFQGDPRMWAAVDESDFSRAELHWMAQPDPSGEKWHDLLTTKTEIEQWASLLELCHAPGLGPWTASGELRWVTRRDHASFGDFSKTRWDVTF